MAAPVCTAAELEAPCLLVPPLAEKQQKTALIYAMALELAALGGTDYTAALSTTLLSDAASLACGMDEPHRMAALVKIAFNNAESAGASIPGEIAVTEAASCLSEADTKALDEAYLLLSCLLGRHAAYPQ